MRGSVWTGPLSLTLLRESRLVSFPSLTKIFPFREFPFLVERNRVPKESVARSLIRASSDLCLHAATRGISLLAAPFFSAQAWSSTRRRCMSGLLGFYSDVCLASDTHVLSSYCLACVRLSLRATKSSLHPLLLTLQVRSCIMMWRSFSDQILIANYLTQK
jgi:hypothetical protein